MFQFEYPYLILLVLLHPVIFFIFKSSSAGKTGLPTIFNPNIKPLAKAFGHKTSSDFKSARFNFILFLIWVALVFAIMSPQNVKKLSKTYVKGYDIVMAIDLSRSMLVQDFIQQGDERNRLDVVKQVAKKFILNRQGDRIALVAFGDDAYLQSPLTFDNSVIASMLENSAVGLAGNSTAIGDAIALSIKTLKDRPDASRVIILLTDGSNTAGKIQPLEAASFSKEFGIKIYSIGIGKKSEKGFFQKNNNIDETTLKKISEYTGGSYFNAEDEASLEKVYKKINEMEKTESEVIDIVIREQLFHIPLRIAIALLFLRILLNFKWVRLYSLIKNQNIFS